LEGIGDLCVSFLPLSTAFFPLSSFYLFVSSQMDFKSKILSELETMRLGESGSAEGKFKALAYKKAIESIKAFAGPVTEAIVLKDLKGIGAKIYLKIQEIVATGSLKAATEMKKSSDVGAMEALLGVYGIGPVKAKALIKAGITSIGALRTAADTDASLLTEAQKIGLRFYESGLERIPRAEMVGHEEILKSLLPSVLSGTIVGSYRRGAVTSGDVDMLVSYGLGLETKVVNKAFQTFVAALEKAYTVFPLATGRKKWMGFVQLRGGPGRRLDLLLTPPEELPYAILYFTGSDTFNVAMRKHATTLGYTMNEHAITKVSATAKDIPVMTKEEDIFAFLGLRYIPPTERVNAEQIIPSTS